MSKKKINILVNDLESDIAAQQQQITTEIAQSFSSIDEELQKVAREEQELMKQIENEKKQAQTALENKLKAEKERLDQERSRQEAEAREANDRAAAEAQRIIEEAQRMLRMAQEAAEAARKEAQRKIEEAQRQAIEQAKQAEIEKKRQEAEELAKAKDAAQKAAVARKQQEERIAIARKKLEAEKAQKLKAVEITARCTNAKGKIVDAINTQVYDNLDSFLDDYEDNCTWDVLPGGVLQYNPDIKPFCEAFGDKLEEAFTKINTDCNVPDLATSAGCARGSLAGIFQTNNDFPFTFPNIESTLLKSYAKICSKREDGGDRTHALMCSVPEALSIIPDGFTACSRSDLKLKKRFNPKKSEGGDRSNPFQSK